MTNQSHQNDQLNTLHLSHEQLCDQILSLTPVAVPDATVTVPGPPTGLHLVSAPSHQAPAPEAVSAAAVEEHLRACPRCAEELNSLRSALIDFHIASTNLATAELRAVSHSLSGSSDTAAAQRARQILLLATKSQKASPARPLAWAVAALLLVGATIGSVVPLRLHHPAQILARPAAAGSQAAPTGESDEALLEEVDQTLSTEVPSAMKPLSDPLSNQNSLASNPIADPITGQTTGKNIDHE